MGSSPVSVTDANDYWLTAPPKTDLYADFYAGVYQAVFSSAAFTAASSSAGVILSDSASSPWWGSRVIELLAHDPAESGSFWSTTTRNQEVTVGLDSEAFSAAAPGHASRTEPFHRRFGLDFGSGVFAAARNAIALLPVVAVVHGAVGTTQQAVGVESLVQPTAIATNAGRFAGYSEDTLWDDSDDEPQWLAMEALPYHGGGVMARRRRQE